MPDRYELPAWLAVRHGGVTIEAKAVPRSRRTRAVGVQDGRLRVQIAAPPHGGQSNAALLAYLAAAAGVRPRSARIRRGPGGSRKLVELDGDPAAIIRRMIDRFGDLDGDG